MDQALNQAAREGNTSKLNQLIEADPTLLQRVLPPFTETPLHIAAWSGEADFATRLLELERSLAKQTNRQGINPLHIASARGHCDVVSALLNSTPELVHIKDIEGATPLHYAAYYGRADVIDKFFLVSDMRKLLKEVNSKRETALHVAIKNKQLEVISLLVQRIENLRDFEFSDQVLKQAKDQFGHSALQLIIDSDIQVFGVISLRIQEFSQSTYDEPRAINSTVGTHPLLKKKIAREAMLVTGILIATVTFQALMDPPKILWENREANNEKIKLFFFFIACNSLSFFASCIGIVLSATKMDISMLNFCVSSALTWAAAGYICVLISMMNKEHFQKIIVVSLIMLIPNVVFGLFFHTEMVRKVLGKFKGLASWWGSCI